MTWRKVVARLRSPAPATVAISDRTGAVSGGGRITSPVGAHVRDRTLTGEAGYEQRALAALRPMADLMARHPTAFGRFLSALDFHLGPRVELALVAPRTLDELAPLAGEAFGRYLPNLVVAILQIISFSVKVLFFCWLQIMIRWTLPRFRYDQLMRLGWIAMMPIGFLNAIVTAMVILAWGRH